jgi:DsbC/DsbD-like thiol-disulfide interchange protein
MRSSRRIALPSVICTLLLLAGARCPFAQSVKFPHGTLSLVTEKAWIEPGREFTVGAHFTLEPGWHIYWVNPGDSGEPPKFTWKLPQGFSAREAEWPAPRRLGSATVADFGYDRDVTLLIPMKAPVSSPMSGTASLEASVRLLICREMCIPGKTTAAISVPIKSETAPPDKTGAALVSAARIQLPEKMPASWRAAANTTKDSFVLKVQGSGKLEGAKFFPLTPSQVDNAAPQQFAANNGGFELTLKKSEELEKPIARLKGVLETLDGKAYAIDAAVTSGAH